MFVPIDFVELREAGKMGTVLSEPVLRGRHVRLEPLGFHHVDALVSAASEDRSTYLYTSVPQDTVEMTTYVSRAVYDRERGESLAFAVVTVDEGRVVGSTRLLDIDYWSELSGDHDTPHFDRGDPPRAVEIGATWYAASAQRTHVNTEAKLLLLTYAFETWNVERVSFKTDARNVRSRRAIERLGASFEGIRRAHRVATDGTIRDSAYFSILRSEWPSVRSFLTTRVDAPI